MIIEISGEERDALIALLSDSIADTREDIYRTEQYRYKENLRLHKQLIEDLLSRLVTPSVAMQSRN